MKLKQTDVFHLNLILLVLMMVCIFVVGVVGIVAEEEVAGDVVGDRCQCG